jgi:hypothetical protein
MTETNQLQVATSEFKKGRKHYLVLIPFPSNEPVDPSVPFDATAFAQSVLDAYLATQEPVKKARGRAIKGESPIHKLAIACGGMKALANLLDVSAGSVHRWAIGKGGKPYPKTVIKLDHLAVEKGITDFII